MKKLLAVFAIILLQTAPMAADESDTTLYLHAMQYEQSGELDEAYKIYKQLWDGGHSQTLALKLAEIEIKRGKLQEAVAIMESAYNEYVDDVEIAFQMGVLYGELGVQYARNSPERVEWMTKSAAAIERAATLEPTESNIFALSLAATDAGDIEKAQAAYDYLIYELKLPRYYRYSGLLKLRSGDKQGAIADLKHAAEESGDVPSYLHLADIYLQDGDTKTATEYLTKVSELNSELVIPDLYLGEYYKNQGEFKTALGYYRQAANAAKDERMKLQILKQSGVIAFELEEYGQAFEMLNEALQISADDQQTFYFAGYAAYMNEDYDAAQFVYYKGLELYPEYAMLRKWSARNLIKLDRAKDAIAVMLAIDPIERDVEYYLIMGTLYDSLDDDKAALEALNEGLDAYPGNSWICIGLANIYEQQKEHDMAIEILKVALKFEPDNAALHNYLGYVYADLDMKLDEAEELVSYALEQEPDNYAYLDSMAWVYFRQGKYKEANELMEKALAINPNDPELIEHNRQIKEKLNK